MLLPQITSYQEIEEDIYQLLNTASSLPAKIISKLEILLAENQSPASSPYQLAIHFIQLLQGMLSHSYPPALSFVFSVIWTYGFYIEDKQLENIFKELSIPDLQTNKNKSKLVRMPSEPGGRTLFKLKL